MENLKSLLTSRRVWTAFLALVVTIVGVAFPNVPAALVQSAQAFCALLIASFTVEDLSKNGAFGAVHYHFEDIEDLPQDEQS